MKTLTPEQRGHIADACGIGEAYIYQVLTSRRIASPELSTQIELASKGEVMRWDLRPDDWHRIWPELRRRKDAPAVSKAVA